MSAAVEKDHIEAEVNSATTSEATSKKTNSTGIKKRVKRVRKVSADDSGNEAPNIVPTNLGANVCKTLTSSPIYFLLLILRFALIFVTPGSLEGIEYADGVDLLAVSLLPGMNSGGLDPAVLIPPQGMGDVNRTRSIAGAFVSSGIPYMGANLVCRKVLGGCSSDWIGYIALYAPRVWMFFLSLIGDVLLVRCFAVYEGEKALYGLLTYASMWTTLLGSTRNMNFALESLCVVGVIAACFGWQINVARPVFWLSATALSFGIFLRPSFAFLAAIPIIYLSNLIGRSGVELLKYIRAALEGIFVFGFWITIWITVDSVWYGTFKLRFGGIVMENFDMFTDYVMKGLEFSYKGKLLYTPLEAFYEIANREYLSKLMMNTSPGQIFLAVPGILGPLFFVLCQEFYKGMKVAIKEVMTELKQAANSKKPKKSKKKKSGMSKELEEEIYVYYDTIQTTFLLGLLIEVMQNNDRLGTLSVFSLMPACCICVAGTIFGPKSSRNFRFLHIAFTIAMVLFFGFMHQSGIPKTLLKAGTGGIDIFPQNTDLVVFKGVIGHRSVLGANVKNISVYDGGDSRLNLMTKIREIKGQDDYHEEKLFICAPGTENMKEEEFKFVQTLAFGHLSTYTLPNNIDDALKKATLNLYKFIGDEDEAIIRDNEEAAEEEELERERKDKKKRRKAEKNKEDEEKDDL